MFACRKLSTHKHRTAQVVKRGTERWALAGKSRCHSNLPQDQTTVWSQLSPFTPQSCNPLNNAIRTKIIFLLLFYLLSIANRSPPALPRFLTAIETIGANNAGSRPWATMWLPLLPIVDNTVNHYCAAVILCAR